MERRICFKTSWRGLARYLHLGLIGDRDFFHDGQGDPEHSGRMARREHVCIRDEGDFPAPAPPGEAQSPRALGAGLRSRRSRGPRGSRREPSSAPMQEVVGQVLRGSASEKSHAPRLLHDLCRPPRRRAWLTCADASRNAP